MRESFLNRAKENLQAAELLYDAGLYNASVNRACYAAFQISISYLFSKGFEPVIDHRNVLSLFINEFINKKKTFPSGLKKIFHELQNARNYADYKSGVNKSNSYIQLQNSKDFFKTVQYELENENKS